MKTFFWALKAVLDLTQPSLQVLIRLSLQFDSVIKASFGAMNTRTPDMERQKLNPRVAKALGADVEVAVLPPRPDAVTPDSVCNWIRNVVPLMDPNSPYRERLIDVLRRYEFRE